MQMPGIYVRRREWERKRRIMLPERVSMEEFWQVSCVEEWLLRSERGG